MHKKILRILSLALAILILVSVLPQEISANELEISEIRQQITSTYKSARKWSGRKSFSGYCASLVNWQMYLMGITEEKVSNNGNQEYDYFAKRNYTSGGYRIHSYPASRYNMEEALNYVSKNGTKDVYNMIICFQSTNSAAGRLYGHAFFVHAILDGIVYFSESSSVSINGKYYAEGSAIACPIKEFCAYYAPWATYEGLIYFGQKTYADECEYFASNLYASITESTDLYSSPCTSQVDDRSKFRSELKAGERVHVTGLYLNTMGEYWYEVDDGHCGFIPADKTEIISLDYSDVKATNISSPFNLRSGTRFGLKGQITSDHNQIYTIRAQVYSVDGDQTTQVYSTTAMVDGTDYSLNSSSLSKNLAFRKLSKGTYLFKLAAVVGNYYYVDGKVQLEWKTIPLYTSQFNVVSSRGGTCNVTFNANGGNVELNQMEVKKGTTLESLPIPQREGYIFGGWYTEAEGGLPLTEKTELTSNTVAYAHWTPDIKTIGWFVNDGTWYYMVGGVGVEGFVEEDGITYYTDTNGVPLTGWQTIGENTYYFNHSGAMQTGIVAIGDARYYLGEDGVMCTGWTEINGDMLYLNPDGSLCAGWITIGDTKYLFDAKTGKLLEVRNNVDGSSHVYS